MMGWATCEAQLVLEGARQQLETSRCPSWRCVPGHCKRPPQILKLSLLSCSLHPSRGGVPVQLSASERINMFKCSVDEESDPKFTEAGELRSEGSDSQAVISPQLLRPALHCVQVPNLQESPFSPCGFTKDPDQVIKDHKPFCNVVYAFQTDWFQTLNLSMCKSFPPSSLFLVSTCFLPFLFVLIALSEMDILGRRFELTQLINFKWFCALIYRVQCYK